MSMRVIIAEKPSLGRAIAENLPETGIPVGRTHIVCGNDVVTWLFGHMLEVQEPPEHKAWNPATLPIDTTLWPQAPLKDVGAQITAIKKLLAECAEVVHAGDAGREGQLLVDELLEYLGCKKPCKRLWLSAMDEVNVKAALNNLKSNTEYQNLSASAKARQDADLLVGLNLTRAYTLAGQKQGYSGVLSVGRVQTPTLALIVYRCLTIENFKPVDYFTVAASLGFQAGSFVAEWMPGDAVETDEAGRVLNKGIAENIKAAIEGQKATVEKYLAIEKKENPPLPYALNGLQSAANKKYGMTAKEVLDIAQELYEAKLTTYPRTDSSYLPESQHADAQRILSSLPEEFSALVAQSDSALRSAAWNDAKITDHHGIIPTGATPGQLSAKQAQIYELIVRSYLAQFFPAYIYQQISVIVEVAGEIFRANGKKPISAGWAVIYGRHDDEEEAELKQDIPALTKGTLGECLEAHVLAKQTTPPPYFTEGTLLEAMCNIHKYEEDPELKRRLKETAGIGTEATRAGIIETLKKRNFIAQKGKGLRDTEAGRKLILALPERVRSPGMTGLFEQALSAIAEGTLTPSQFLAKQREFVTKYVEHALSNTIDVGSSGNKQAGPEIDCPECQEGKLRRIKGAKGFFWGCNRFKEGCKATYQDASGKPQLKRAAR
jgi:DNA topoisomerase-3